jgi:fucose permease
VERASYLLAAYWAAIMLSRLALSRMLLQFGPQRIVFGGAVLSAAGAVIVALAPSTSVAVIGVLITAAALAGIFPTVLGIAGGAFRDHSGVVFGILFTVALTGGMTMPWLAGQLAEASGLRSVFVLVAINFAIIAMLNRVAGRRLG